MKEKTYNFKVKVVKKDGFNVLVEGAGFTGTGYSSQLGNAFAQAYESVIDQASEALLKDG